MKGILLTKTGHPTDFLQVKHDLPKPDVGPNDVLIQVKAAGLNPVDWKMAKSGVFVSDLPMVLGCDAGGIVKQVGSNVKRFKVGDEVAAFTPIGPAGCGTFAEFCKCPEDLILHKPADWSFEEAATLPVVYLTAALGLHHSLEAPFPGKKPETEMWILIWGASSSVGSFAVQLAKASGLKVVGTASRHNFDKVKQMGADAVFDYHSDTVVEDIKKTCKNHLTLVYDAVGSIDQAFEALNTAGPCRTTSCVEMEPDVPENVSFNYTLLGNIYAKGQEEKRKWLAAQIPLYEKLVAERTIQPMFIEKVKGFDGIIDGLKRLSANKVSGTKIIATI
eukprot:m.14353 g.14353  ORF g.14353 m.14353 type:complete len:333 (-) comp7590_c0_seq1:359-1357(-)